MAGTWVQLTGKTVEAREASRETVSAVNMDHVAEVRFTELDFAVVRYSHGATLVLEPEDAVVIRDWLMDRY
jgi:hypothetical protein